MPGRRRQRGIHHARLIGRRVYGALLAAMLVVCRVCAESGRV